MLIRAIIIFLHTHMLLTIVVWPSLSFAFTSSLPKQQNKKLIIQSYAHPPTGSDSDNPSCYTTTGNKKQIMIQKIALDDSEELQRMSKFCIKMFYNNEEDDGLGTSLLSR